MSDVSQCACSPDGPDQHPSSRWRLQLISLDVEATDSIGKLKELIQDKAGILATQQELFFAGKRLTDGGTLADRIVPVVPTLKFLLLACGRPPRRVECRVNIPVEFLDTIESPQTHPILPVLPDEELPEASSPAKRPKVALVHCIDWAHCHFATASVSTSTSRYEALLRQCISTITSSVRGDDRAYYIGVAVHAAMRWHDPRIGHHQNYEHMRVLVQGPSAVTVRLEIDLVDYFRGPRSMLANKVQGGGGLSPCHAVSCLYLCLGGKRTQEPTLFGRRRRIYCGNALCLGRCADCVW